MGKILFFEQIFVFSNSETALYEPSFKFLPKVYLGSGKCSLNLPILCIK